MAGLGMTEAQPAGARWALTLLFLIYVCNNMDRHLISILAEPIRQDLALSDTQLGMLSGLVFALFYTIFGIPAGWLADRHGRTKVIMIACLIWSACSALGGWATNFAQLAAARIGVGIGESGGSAPSYSLISAYYPPVVLTHFGLLSPRTTRRGTRHLSSGVARRVVGGFGRGRLDRSLVWVARRGRGGELPRDPCRASASAYGQGSRPVTDNPGNAFFCLDPDIRVDAAPAENWRNGWAKLVYRRRHCGLGSRIPYARAAYAAERIGKLVCDRERIGVRVRPVVRRISGR